MSCGRRRWSLGSLLLLLGGNLGVLVEIHQDSINGTVGQSVLLPVSYRFDGAPGFPVSILWTFSNSSDTLVTCTVLNCSLGAGGAPSGCSAKCFSHSTYRGRAELFPQNGSLLLRDLQLSDSGVYSVAFRRSSQAWHVALAVHEQPFTPAHAGEGNPSCPALPALSKVGASCAAGWLCERNALCQPCACPACVAAADTTEQDHLRYCAIGICSSISLLLLFLLFCCIRHRGAAQRKKRRIIKQQQVSSVEESPTESTAVRDVATIYARIGDSFEQPQPRPTPEVVYTSITSAGPPGLGTGPYHLLA